MTDVVGAVLDPGSVVGTSGFIPAGGHMELGRIGAVRGFASAPSFEVQGPIIDAAFAATTPTLSVPVVVPTQVVSHEYVERYAFSVARARGAFAEALADQLEHDTAHLSSVRRAAGHPAYAPLVSLGPASVATALRRLSGADRPLWLFFLQQVTGDRPASETDSVDEASALWRKWGQERGLIG